MAQQPMQDNGRHDESATRPFSQGAQPGPAPMSPGDEAPEGTPGTGENICPHCSGTGRHGDAECPVCLGSGKVVTGIGGA